MESVITLFNALPSDPTLLVPITFVFMLFVGEPVVLAMSFIAATAHLLSYLELTAIAFMTALIGELFWFFIGRTNLTNRLENSRIFSESPQEFKDFASKFGSDRPISLLFWSRLVSGLSIVVILFLAKRGMRVRTYLAYSALVNAFWSPIVVAVGYSAGLGFTTALTIFEDVRTGVLAGLLLLGAFYIVYRIIRTRFILPRA